MDRIVGNIDALQSVEYGCHSGSGLICIGTLVELVKMSKVVHDNILVTDVLVEAFDVTLLMVRQLVVVGMLRCESKTPGVVCQWIVTVARGFSNGSRDLGCGILEEELS